ncbi:MAG: hypothetical protein GY832_14040 [Chloroflexi bacterium]|nr:hypothetical protein [Chloroflexota bacterium]
MPQNLLKNEGFEADWDEERSHRCLIIPENAGPYDRDIGNIFTPPNWLMWFHHDPGTWDQPEVRDAWKQQDTRRAHGGQKGILLFTFGRKHDGGFLQQVQVTPGTLLSMTAWAHAWSNHRDKAHPDRFPHPDDGRWSEGAGFDPGFCLEGEAPDDNWRNFIFYVGIDPTGGTNPLADTVVWGQGAHIYNEYAQVPPVEATAQAGTVTVFLRSKTLWPFKHNDAYWDDAELLVADGGKVIPPPETPEMNLRYRPTTPQVGEAVTVEVRSLIGLAGVNLALTQPSGTTLARGSVVVGRDGNWHTWTYTTAPLDEAGTHKFVFSAVGDLEMAGTFEGLPLPESRPKRGVPRVQYRRIYVLLPPHAGEEWGVAVVNGMWDDRRYTVGSSADDAGIGDLDERKVIAVNPSGWPTDLQVFFDEHYPGVEFAFVEAATPAELVKKLKQL